MPRWRRHRRQVSAEPAGPAGSRFQARGPIRAKRRGCGPHRRSPGADPPEPAQRPQGRGAVGGTASQPRPRRNVFLQMQGRAGGDAGAFPQFRRRPQHVVGWAQGTHRTGQRTRDGQRQAAGGRGPHDIAEVHEGQRRIDPMQPGCGPSEHVKMEVDLGRGTLDFGNGARSDQISCSLPAGGASSNPYSSFRSISAASSGSGSARRALRHCMRASGLRPVRHSASP